jgi:endonuclease/exonuclease/phosphatase family metal-dependent hydrolase
MKKLLLLLSLFAATLAQAITVATYNVENYLVANRMVDGVYRPAYPKPQAEKHALAKVISAISPDVLAVEEMGKQIYLDDFQRELKHVGQDFPHMALLEAADADRHVAILSKIPFKEVKRHADVTLTYFGQKDVVKRGVLEAIFATNEGDVSVFVIHLKSKRTERADDPEGTLQRQEEARAVRDLVLARHPDPTKAKFVVTGDWNDTRGSKPVQALLKRGDTKLGELLRTLDSRGESWTHYFRREDLYSRIDFLLVSPALLPFVEGKEGKIYDGEASTTGSDHRVVYAKFNLTPVQ